MKGEIVGERYHVLRLIGVGDFGTVYHAYDPSFGREVAVKVFTLSYQDPDFRSRIYREISLATKLEHAAIVPVYDIGEHDNRPYYVMRYMRGGSLSTRLKNGPISPQEASLILERLASALDKLHDLEIIHRNIKPTNVLLDSEGLAYLSDFAMVHTADTDTQAMIGTRTYMAPEQVLGKRLDKRTDVYQLGTLLFEMLTGRPPYTADSPLKIALMHVSDPIPSLLDYNLDLSSDYQQVIAMSMAKHTDERYTTAGHMAATFSSLLGSSSGVLITKPILNPFVVGNPVEGDLFVGRDETFNRLRELWGTNATRNVSSVVLFGHRRMGKTSILLNLGTQFGRSTLVANFNMQRAGRIANTGELLCYISLAMYDSLVDAGLVNIKQPQLSDYEYNGYPAFNNFLRFVRKEIIKPQNEHPIKKREFFVRFLGFFDRGKTSRLSRIILAIDEFEIIEKAIADGFIDSEFLDFLRGVVHSEPWLIIALAGLHTLEEMTADYWNPLYASVTPVKVSFLSRNATAKLLTQPSNDFLLEFTNATIDRIYALTQGQPYLTQLIAHSLVSDYNQTVFERGQARSHRFTPNDVDRVVSSSMLYDQGNYYFTGVWSQAQMSGPKGQIPILYALANSEEPLSVSTLSEAVDLDEVDLDEESLRMSLETLLQHDVVKITDNNCFDFTVPLMRRWIQDVKL